MSRTRNVVWTEGLFLTPHLFQQADRYRDDLLNFRLKPLSPFFWGVTEIEIDREGLRNGWFTLRRCSGVMKDGLTMQIPTQDKAPESLEVKFAPPVETLEVFLAIAENRTDSINFYIGNGSAGQACRYRMEKTNALDETTDNNESEIPVATKNFQILFGNESLQGKTTMKIAEIGRTVTGEITLRESYSPPAISLAGADRLMAILHGIVETLTAKSNALSQQRRNITEFGSSDVPNFWLLHTVNSFVPVLTHIYLVGKHHPEYLYTVLAQLIGELSTFSLEPAAREVPRYDHENLFQTFDELEQKIRFLLETIIPEKYVIIPLTKTTHLWYEGQIQDDRLFKNAQFFLAANAAISVTKLIAEIPLNAKISSPDEVNRLIGQAVPGVSLVHEGNPPNTIPVKPGYKYFHLDARGRWWDAICRTRNLALYLPDEFPVLKVELVALRD